MATTLRGPAILLAQFAGDAAPLIGDQLTRATDQALDDFAHAAGRHPRQPGLRKG